jgi:hypothetical protein
MLVSALMGLENMRIGRSSASDDGEVALGVILFDGGWVMDREPVTSAPAQRLAADCADKAVIRSITGNLR